MTRAFDRTCVWLARRARDDLIAAEEKSVDEIAALRQGACHDSV